MGSTGTVRLAAVFDMLEECAPGHTRKQRQHNWLVCYADKAYPGLPLGPHGARKNPEIQIGHVRQLVRFFGLGDCARRHIPQL